MKAQTHRIKYYVLGFYLLLLAVWQGLYAAQVLPDYLFPSPLQVVRRLWELGADNYLWPSLRATFQRMGIGFAIAAAAGLCGCFPGNDHRQDEERAAPSVDRADQAASTPLRRRLLSEATPPGGLALGRAGSFPRYFSRHPASPCQSV